MFALLLVACGAELSDSGPAEPDFSMAPVSLSKSYPYGTLYNHGDTLVERFGSVYIVNDGPDPLDLEALATYPGSPFLDEGAESWIDVSVLDDVVFPLAGGQQVSLDYWAWGVIHEGDELPRGIYSFDLVVTLGGVDQIVHAEVILEPIPG